MISNIHYRVKDSEKLSEFYLKILELNVDKLSDGCYKISFDTDSNSPFPCASIILSNTDKDTIGYCLGRDKKYWKLGFTMHDVSSLVENISSKGISASTPHQFIDVGFMSHIADSEGFTIELLQESFEQNFILAQFNENYSNSINLGMVTLRYTDIDAALRFYCDVLRMRLVCREKVDDYGFHLYFLIFGDDKPPSDDIDALENREWLYKRKYTYLEIQTFVDEKYSFKNTSENEYGFTALEFKLDTKQIKSTLDKKSISYKVDNDTLYFESPESTPIIVSSI